MTNTVDLRVDGDRIDIEVEELSDLDMMLWAGRAPESLMGRVSEVKVDEDIVEFLIDLSTSQTLLTRDLLEELPQEELSRLFNGVVIYAFDSDEELPDRSSGETTIEWNDSGSVDLDDWE
jgi:hypothetical protein